jgi:hypothetical protein
MRNLTFVKAGGIRGTLEFLKISLAERDTHNPEFHLGADEREAMKNLRSRR